MGTFSKNDLRELLYGADKTKYSHMVVYCDTWDYDDFVNFVLHGEDIKDYINKRPDDMIKVMEVYDLNLDYEMQLNEQTAYHIEQTGYVINKKVLKALKYAEEKHKDQIRTYSKIPYIEHPKNVAKLIRKYKGESKNIDELEMSAYLHDTIEDTDATFEELLSKFGLNVAYLVKELTTDKKLKEVLGKEKYLAYKLNDMTNYALDIKLCDRLDNIADLNESSEQFKNKYFFETIHIINFIIDNRKLTDTQKNIIKDIMTVLENTKIDTKSLIKTIN